jgi:hypothetical protein
MVRMTTKLEKRLRRTAHEKGWLLSPSLGMVGVPFGSNKMVDLSPGAVHTPLPRCQGCPTCDISGDFPRDAPGFDLDQDLLFAIEAELKALGWDVEYLTGYEAKIGRRDPVTGKDSSFGVAWMSWRKLDGAVVYGVGADRDPHDILVPRGPADDPKSVAAAADQAMHMLWHREADEEFTRLYAERNRLSLLKQRIAGLGRRPVVTSGQIRTALAEHEKPSA